MATRSRIAIENENGSVTSIYCHYDGYPEHNGAILQEHYTDHEKVKKLIALGDISILSHEVDIPEGVEHSFETPVKGITVAYHRDRGDDFHQKSNASVNEFFNGDIQEYGYCFTAAGEWLAKSASGNWRGVKPLEDVLKVVG
jgi:hypothetical protein